MMHHTLIRKLGAWFSLLLCPLLLSAETNMEELWGEQIAKLRAGDAERGQLFDEGNYAMFIHWGLYSNLANKVDGKTYYGIGEWIMNRSMADIPVERYKNLAKDFNPVKFDAKAIAQLAKDAGMKYIIITSKHHDGFAMYHSKVNKFNIVDATPWNKDPMKELADACSELGLGFGFYYSHNVDWTYPGGRGGPKVDEDGTPATFEDYFLEKCLPQVEEITTQYGPIELIWFDLGGGMKKHFNQQIIDLVRKNQPHALISGRIGGGMGDYQTLGDMEVPMRNIEGMWETVDTTNDSWAYAWYDENWKTPKEILHRVIACVARGGTYMLNIGPRGDGSVPKRAAQSLRKSGEWIQRYPQVVYGTDASPWGRAFPWGDVTVKDTSAFLTVFEWPENGKLYLPGLKTGITSLALLEGSDSQSLDYHQTEGWTIIELPIRAPEDLASVIKIDFKDSPVADPTHGLDPENETKLLALFADVKGAQKAKKSWMEKFGEWKAVTRITQWTEDSSVTWEVDVLEPGDYQVALTYNTDGSKKEPLDASLNPRLVWRVAVEGGEAIQNQQNSSHVYQQYPIGWLNFPEPGKYKIEVNCVEGERMKHANLKAIHFKPVKL